MLNRGWVAGGRRKRFVAARSTTMALTIAAASLFAPLGEAATPMGTPVAFDADPGNCTIAPRTLDDLARLFTPGTPVVPMERPTSGERIDPSSEAGQGVIATIETLFACLNAGDRLRAYALYTDAYLATILRPGDLPAVATPYPNDPDEFTRILDITLHALADGRVIATVVLDPALIPVDKIFEFILVPVHGQWKIDGVINELDFSVP